MSYLTQIGTAPGQTRDAALAIAAELAAQATASLALARTAKTYPITAFGAFVDGGSHPFGTSYPGITTLAAAAAADSRLAWMALPAYGLTFTLTTTTVAGSTSAATLTFLTTGSNVNNGTYTYSQFNMDPANRQKRLCAGFLVSGSGFAAGTTVSSFDPTTGIVTLSANPSAAIPIGTVLTFTMNQVRLQGLEMDYIGMQSAAYAAAMALGGTVAVPSGDLVMNYGVINPGMVNGGTFQGNVNLLASGRASTRIRFTTDLGVGHAIWSPANVGQNDIGYGYYAGFRALLTVGTPNTVGNAVAGMIGWVVGAKDILEHASITQFRAGAAVWEDHNVIRNCDLGSNYSGIWMAPYTNVIGNQLFDSCGVGNSAFAGIEIDGTNTLDFSIVRNMDMGGCPHSIGRPITRAAIGGGSEAAVFGFITNSVLEHLFCEQVGQEVIYAPNAGDNIQYNSWTHFVPWINSGTQFRIGGVGATAIILCNGVFSLNDFRMSDFNGQNGQNCVLLAQFQTASNPATTGAALVRGRAIQQNRFGDQTSYSLGGGQVPFIVNTSACFFNRCHSDRAKSIEFMIAESAIAAGQVMAFGADGTIDDTPNLGTLCRVMGTSAGAMVPRGVAIFAAATKGCVMVVTEGLATVNKDAVAMSIGSLLVASASTAGSTTTTAVTTATAGIGIMVDTAAKVAGDATVNVYVKPSLR